MSVGRVERKSTMIYLLRKTSVNYARDLKKERMDENGALFIEKNKCFLVISAILIERCRF